MSEFIEFLSPSALSEMEKANAELVKMVANVISVQTEMGKINTPSGGDAGVKQLTLKYDEQAKSIQKLQSEIEKQRLAEIRLQQAREKSVDTFAKQSAQELNSVKKQSGLYNITQNQIRILTEQYNDLATKKALGIKLTNDESFQLYKLTGQLNLYRGALKQVDSDVQLNQRNVGNYKGVFEQATQAGNQFTSFLTKVYSKVRVLAYILPGIGIGGIFGLALEPLFNFLKGLDFVQKAFGIETEAAKKAKEAIIEKTKAEAEQNREISNTVASETTKAKILFENIKNEKLSMADRISNFKELQKNYKTYLGDLTLQQALAGDTAIAEERLNEAMVKRGLALSIQSLLQKNAQQQIEQELKYGSALKETTTATNLYNDAGNNVVKTSTKLRMIRQSELDNLDNLKMTEKTNTESTIKNGEKISVQLLNNSTLRNKSLIPIKEEEKALLNLYKIYAPYLDLAKKETSSTKQRTRLNYAEVESLYNLKIARLEEQRLLAESQMNNKDATDYGRLQARKEFSDLSVQILDEQYAREKAMSDLKFKEDLDKANEIYQKNKKNGYDDIQNSQEWAKAIQDITNRHNNEIELSNINHSKKFKDLMYSDAAFNEKILQERYEKDKKLRDKTYEETNKLNELINKAEQKKYQKIANDEKLTLKTRQEAFLAYQDLAYRQLDIQKILELSKADPTEYDAIIEKYKELKDAIAEIESPLDKANEKTKAFIEGFQTEQLINALKSFGLESAKMFLDFDAYGQSTFSKLLASAKTTQEEFAVTFNAIAEVAQSAFNTISEASQKNFDAEYARLEEQKNIALLFAGDSATARAEIEQQYEQRRKQIARREAKAKKEQAIVNIAIDTAQAIVATLAKTPLPLGLPFVIMTAALGAAQLAMVASQQIPQYWTGTDNAEGGLAWTQEKGREIITDSQGRVKSLGSDKGAELTMLSKGDKVFTAEKSAMMFDNSLNSMLLNNGIVMPKVEVSMDTQILGSKLDKLSETIASKESFSIVRDAKGERIYQRKQNERKELLNNILNVKTYGV